MAVFVPGAGLLDPDVEHPGDLLDLGNKAGLDPHGQRAELLAGAVPACMAISLEMRRPGSGDRAGVSIIAGI
jgi:hypothetical protein